jgi:hypothetical protein
MRTSILKNPLCTLSIVGDKLILSLLILLAEVLQDEKSSCNACMCNQDFNVLISRTKNETNAIKLNATG